MEGATEAFSGVTAGFKASMKDCDIEQGPSFLRFLGFITAFASLVCSVYKLCGIMSAIGHPVMYLLYGYIAVFASSTMLFEAKHEWIEKISFLSKYQDMLIKHCSFLTLMGGRGVFYIFQATLWLTFSDSLGEIIYIACASAMGFIGLLHILAHVGIMPHHLASKAVASFEKISNKDLDGDGKIGA